MRLHNIIVTDSTIVPAVIYIRDKCHVWNYEYDNLSNIYSDFVILNFSSWEMINGRVVLPDPIRVSQTRFIVQGLYFSKSLQTG